MMSSLAPRGVIMSNMPTPSRTSSRSTRKYASASGTTRTDQSGLLASDAFLAIGGDLGAGEVLGAGTVAGTAASAEGHPPWA